jgi:hypothetical protein
MNTASFKMLAKTMLKHLNIELKWIWSVKLQHSLGMSMAHPTQIKLDTVKLKVKRSTTNFLNQSTKPSVNRVLHTKEG